MPARYCERYEGTGVVDRRKREVRIRSHFCSFGGRKEIEKNIEVVEARTT